MKISSVTPPLMRSVPWSTHFDSKRMPPNSASDTATVMMPATVINTLRRSETIVSRAKYASLVHMGLGQPPTP
jgi:hypothetical protein